MTQPRSLLHPSSAAQLAAIALSAQGEYGIVTDLAREHSIRRQSVYDIRERGRTALTAEFTPVVPELKGSFKLEVTPADMERAVVALRVVTPASIRDIAEVLPVLFGKSWSYGKVQGVLCKAEQLAAAQLAQVDLSKIESVALDEMFSQGRPVLAGICLDSQYLFQLEVSSNRSGDAWAESLGKLRDDQGLCPKRVVKDAGSGLRAGVQKCWPGVAEHDDLFHAVYIMGKEAFYLERRAYGTMTKVEDLTHRLVKAKTKAKRKTLTEQLQQARENMDEAIGRSDHFERLQREAERVLELTDRGSGVLRTSTEVVEVLTSVAAEMATIAGKRVSKVATYIANRAEGLALYLDSLAERLHAVTETAGGVKVVEAAIRANQASLMMSKACPFWDRNPRRQELRDATQHLLAMTQRDGERLRIAVGTIMPQLANRYRASSAIENLNSILRPYLVVQKHAEQGFLNLFQFYHNTRTRQWGRWKGTSALETLTGNKVDDWLTLLGFPPSPPSEAVAIAA